MGADTENRVTVIGGGFAGCEAARALSRRGVKVRLYEMKPARFSPAHRREGLCELVCSNSFKAERVDSASGLLKAEMEKLGSLTVAAAKRARVPAGGALAVDRDEFSRIVTEELEKDENIEIIREEVCSIPDDGFVIVAAGPLASDALAEDIRRRFGDTLSFYDAAAPVVTAESVDMSRAFTQSRYDRGGADDYINCPMNKAEFEAFRDALVSAEGASLHEIDVRRDVYEGCMPIEALAKRGADAIRYGPMKPVGLTDPATGRRPWANLQLRKENSAGTLLNLVGFQTNLKFGEQKRVFSMIPALENAEFVRYGVMHRNTFLDSPRVLRADFSVKDRPELFFAGQITGTEGYMESAAGGIIAGINAARRLRGRGTLVLPRETMIGALQRYISDATPKTFQPMGAAFGLLPPLDEKIRDKRERYAALAERSLELLALTDTQ